MSDAMDGISASALHIFRQYPTPQKPHMNGPKLTMPTRTLLQGMPYTPSHATNLRERFKNMQIEMLFGKAVQPIKREQA